MVTESMMDELNALGFGADIDALESAVAKFQEAAAMGSPIVADDIYDQHFRLLKQLKPDSLVINRNWESEDNDLESNDELLRTHPMASITTMKSLSDMGKFKEALGKYYPDGVTMHVAYKLNGHGVRAVYEYGNLTSGSTRGRTKKGRDITRHLKAVLPNYVDAWKDIPLLEVRGEMLVSFKNFVEQFEGSLKTPLSAVTSLVRDSVTDEELKYLDMLCYKIFTEEDSRLQFGSLSEQYEELEARGFRVPKYQVIPGVGYFNLDEVVSAVIDSFGAEYGSHEYPYYCDGLVLSVNNTREFVRLGYDGKNMMGNIALKIGEHWGAKVYTGIIESIIFVPGKKYLTPKANIRPVRTVSGPEVTTVPLYNVGVMEEYGLVHGASIYFEFGGETGVTLVDQYGNHIGDR